MVERRYKPGRGLQFRWSPHYGASVKDVLISLIDPERNFLIEIS
jgi:hypothetical protein